MNYSFDDLKVGDVVTVGYPWAVMCACGTIESRTKERCTIQWEAVPGIKVDFDKTFWESEYKPHVLSIYNYVEEELMP